MLVMSDRDLLHDQWRKIGQEIGATHIISVRDTDSGEDYPVYVMPDENVDDLKKEYDNVNMQVINTTIDLSKD
jgi:hypothetical protein